MDIFQLSTQFDILYNNTMSNYAPGLDEFEKSIFLTKAVDDLVRNYYKGINITYDSFEKTEEMRRFLSTLVKGASCSAYTSSSPAISKVTSDSKLYSLPSDLMYIIYEHIVLNTTTPATCDLGRTIDVVPVTHDEYSRIKNNPFKGPGSNRALRLDLENNVVEIVSDYSESTASYFVRYLSQPAPVILENLPEGVDIKSKSTAQGCCLPESFHQEVVEYAVKLALASKAG